MNRLDQQQIDRALAQHVGDEEGGDDDAHQDGHPARRCPVPRCSMMRNSCTPRGPARPSGRAAEEQAELVAASKRTVAAVGWVCTSKSGPARPAGRRSPPSARRAGDERPSPAAVRARAIRPKRRRSNCSVSWREPPHVPRPAPWWRSGPRTVKTETCCAGASGCRRPAVAGRRFHTRLLSPCLRRASGAGGCRPCSSPSGSTVAACRTGPGPALLSRAAA